MFKRTALFRLAAIGWVLAALALYVNGWFLVPYVAFGFLYLFYIEDRCTGLFTCTYFVIGWLLIVTLFVTILWKDEYRDMPVKQALGSGWR